MNQAPRHRVATEFCIAVSEEQDFRHHIWFPPFPESELEAKWQAMPSCGMKGIFDFIGGEWISQDNGEWIPQSDGTKKYMHGEMELFDSLWRPDRYIAHICCDEDSYLCTPDGRVLVHAGFDKAHWVSDCGPVGVAVWLEKWRNEWKQREKSD